MQHLGTKRPSPRRSSVERDAIAPNHRCTWEENCLSGEDQNAEGKEAAFVGDGHRPKGGVGLNPERHDHKPPED
ncbi:hypothetical protein GCM10011335_42070 [Aureimonas glaciei]|uniref:Uncharacterized protein n=1 Tax=Aureimonas glaciei TaxID=1776957 RepID=A0A917DG72_9HYPH|nr:hypothetical protein GCM10011335_42070 [Aureimonas glaciei]